MVKFSLVVEVLSTIPPLKTEEGKILTWDRGVVSNTTVVLALGKITTWPGGIVGFTQTLALVLKWNISSSARPCQKLK